MKAEPGDRIQPEPARRQFPVVSAVVALCILLAVGIAWFLVGGQEPAPQPEPPVAEQPAVPEPLTEPEPAPPEPMPPAPDIPAREEPEPAPAADVVEPATPEPPPLTLEDSDPLIRPALEAASGEPLFADMLMSDDLARRATAMVDGFSRGLVLGKVLPFSSPKPAFKPSGQGEHLYMGPDNYVRFNWVAEALAGVDVTVLVNVFHEHRDLFEMAYAELGYPQDQFDNAVIRSLDLVLATPEIRRPIELERKKVFYTYVDPTLEELPDLQKQMLRMGPDNLAKVKDWARRLRRHLLNP